MKWVFRKNLPANRKAFTLMEVSVALVILGMITATVLVVINRAIDTVVAWQTKMEAFDVARENMEKLLMKSSVSDGVENGISDTNPDINWETTIESFYEPISNRMWARAVCTSKYKDNEGQEKKIELTQWITSVSKEQVKQILGWEYKQKRLGLAKISDNKSQQNPQNQSGQQQNPQQNQSGQQQDQPQNQQQQQQQSQDDEAQEWKDIENIIGPPPQGYNNWGQVPSDQFWKAVMGSMSNK
ncbi:MAG: prepilin-type N-terminal cleavage/methylation domain-containing protein [Sedimentisphaerales bacterium]|jgi:prepilin-type N-terminal cleavage/methylation domain-containing protein